MNLNQNNPRFLQPLTTAMRISLITLFVLCCAYPITILAVAQTLRPYTADGSPIQDKNGNTVGSELIAQGFKNPKYFWPRPSAVNFNASAAAGSNLSPASSALRSRAEGIVADMNILQGSAIPADLVTASGSGLDPHISLAGARAQLERVAVTRGLPVSTISATIEQVASETESPPGEPLVNVLMLNLAMDQAEL